VTQITYRTRDEFIVTFYGIDGRRIIYIDIQVIRVLQIVPTSNSFTKLEHNATAVVPQ
jgi:hypothetical protein